MSLEEALDEIDRLHGLLLKVRERAEAAEGNAVYWKRRYEREESDAFSYRVRNR